MHPIVATFYFSSAVDRWRWRRLPLYTASMLLPPAYKLYVLTSETWQRRRHTYVQRMVEGNMVSTVTSRDFNTYCI